MEATRVRFGAILEWVLAAMLIAAVVAAGTVLVREFRTVRAVVPVIAGEAHLYYDPPAVIPAGAVSVPLVLLADGQELRVGDRASDLAARIGALTMSSESIERTGVRERLTRFYSGLGVQFAVVLEALEQSEPQVAAIYLR
jgi:hypothetical protein